jgi:serine/threonine protein kinase
MVTCEGLVIYYYSSTNSNSIPDEKANIFVDEHGHSCIADFGLTVVGYATATARTSDSRGCTRWMAPELLRPDPEISQKSMASDVYAFACVCFEVSGRAQLEGICCLCHSS